jgi:Protein of unknown function (DUF3365)
MMVPHGKRSKMGTAAAGATLLTVLSAAPPPGRESPGESGGALLPTTAEAKVRAQLLHATIQGTLSVMHRDFFRKGDNRAIPSESLTDVFKTLADDWQVRVRWLASDETIMNVDNKASDDFQKRAMAAITGGAKEVAEVEKGVLRFAGSIPLQNQCLKCHAPDRKSLEDRFAALEISLPVQSQAR